MSKLEQLMEQFLELQIRQQKHDAIGTPNWIAPHGPVYGTNQYGPFAYPGTDPEAFSTLVRPQSIAELLARKLKPSKDSNPIRMTLTGVNDPSSCTNADDACGTPPPFGFKKACRQSRTWGRAFFRTNEIDISSLDQRTNISDIDINIINMSPERNPLLPMPPGMSMESVDLNNAVMQLFWEAMIGFERSLSPALIYGDPTVAPAQAECGFITEPLGIMDQIKTGHTDLLPPYTACPAVDSIVWNWGQDLGDTAGSGDTRDFVKYLGDAVYSTVQNARKFGNVNPGHAFLMHPDFWRELANYWPCNFDTTRCKTALTSPTGNGSVVINLDPNERENMRQDMIANNRINVDGTLYDVILDDSMQWDVASPYNYTTEIAFVPWNFVDFEYKPMNAEEARTAMGVGNTNSEAWNNGLWMAGLQQTYNCMHWHFTAWMRTHLLAPQLAFKIQNIAVESRTEVRDYNPGDSYYKDGGTQFTPDYIG